jgi:hypothetical protein
VVRRQRSRRARLGRSPQGRPGCAVGSPGGGVQGCLRLASPFGFGCGSRRRWVLGRGSAFQVRGFQRRSRSVGGRVVRGGRDRALSVLLPPRHRAKLHIALREHRR